MAVNIPALWQRTRIIRHPVKPACKKFHICAWMASASGLFCLQPRPIKPGKYSKYCNLTEVFPQDWRGKREEPEERSGGKAFTKSEQPPLNR